MSDSPPRVQCATTVDLLSGSDIESFIKAISANEADTVSIQGFRISSGEISRSVGDTFAGVVLKHAHLGVLKIRHLELHHAEAFLGSSYRLASAFAACTTITHFILDEVGDHARELLVNSRFSLVSANLSMPDLDDDEVSESSSEEDGDSSDDSNSDHCPNGRRDPDYHARHNPIVLLRNSRRTLESLTGSGCKTICTKTKTKTIKDLSFKHVYPRLTSLSLLQCAEVPPAFRLVSAFPNLRTLHVSFSLDAIMDAREAPPVGGFRVRRKANQDKQRVFGTWKSLEACHAPLLEHYLLGLTCRVERIHMQGDHMDANMLSQVLRSTAPAHLSLDGFDADVFGGGFLEALSNLSDECVKTLEGLEIALDLGSTLNPDKIDVEEALVSFSSR